MKHLCIALIRFYRRYLSRLKPYPTCRFTPTCSAYSLEAFRKRGFFAGLVLMLWRILRCSPLSPGGYDPVPEKGFRTMPLRWSKYDRWVSEQKQNRDVSGEPAEEAAQSSYRESAEEPVKQPPKRAGHK